MSFMFIMTIEKVGLQVGNRLFGIDRSKPYGRKQYSIRILLTPTWLVVFPGWRIICNVRMRVVQGLYELETLWKNSGSHEFYSPSEPFRRYWWSRLRVQTLSRYCKGSFAMLVRGGNLMEQHRQPDWVKSVRVVLHNSVSGPALAHDQSAFAGLNLISSSHLRAMASGRQQRQLRCCHRQTSLSRDTCLIPPPPDLTLFSRLASSPASHRHDH